MLPVNIVCLKNLLEALRTRTNLGQGKTTLHQALMRFTWAPMRSSLLHTCKTKMIY